MMLGNGFCNSAKPERTAAAAAAAAMVVVLKLH
jgi:hypothetical protein